MNTFEAIKFVGGLSAPSKMPCQGYSISALRCITGAKMAKVEGSICSKCYALRGNYRYSNVQNSQEKRYQSLLLPEWSNAMATAILGSESSGFFRWHDAGDLQGVWHLQKIVEVCNLTPSIKHWLPTREFAIVGDFIKGGGVIPENLCIRFSALMFDGQPPEKLAKRYGVQVSGASKENFTCPASKQGNKCLTCRACWDKTAFNVTYKRH
jgi:hypothetical protein